MEDMIKISQQAYGLKKTEDDDDDDDIQCDTEPTTALPVNSKKNN